MDTNDAINYELGLFESGEHDLMRNIQLIKDSEALFESISHKLGSILSTDDDPNS